MDKGVYCLLLECTAPQAIRIGALGEREFVPGWYLYAGSALGSGGLSRVSRHIRFYREQYRRPKWHIDYLMAAKAVRLRKVVCAKTEADLECVLAAALGGDGVPAFGCSDCDCATHLFYRREMPETEVLTVFSAAGLCGLVHEVDGRES
ncbi:MAG: GIY-YIG nuclease family protein [Methanocorpusculum sp.]|nr:GIY-YIG nuclease family protein [Methanocorpusculum sp.]